MSGGVILERDKLIDIIDQNRSNTDERVQTIKLKSFYKGYLWGFWMLIIIMVIRMFAGVDFNSDLGMILTGQSTYVALYLYKQNQNKKFNLLMVLANAAIFLIFTYKTVVYYGFI